MNELIPISAISPLRQRLIDDMAMRRFGQDTQRNSIRDVGRFATWLGRSPHTATPEDLRRFQIEQHEAGCCCMAFQETNRTLILLKPHGGPAGT